jgi:hypothetical protein
MLNRNGGDRTALIATGNMKDTSLCPALGMV